jgi:signal transduction histidine kinase
MSLRSTIWSALILIAVLSVGGAALLSYRAGEEVLKQAALERLVAVRESRKMLIEAFFEDAVVEAGAVARTLHVSRSVGGKQPAGKIRQMLQDVQQRHRYSDVMVVNRNGMVVSNAALDDAAGRRGDRPSLDSLFLPYTQGSGPSLVRPREPFIIDYEHRDDWKRPAECIVVFPPATSAGDGGYILVLVSAELLTELTGAGRSWIDTGMRRTDEVYIVGPDGRLRTNPTSYLNDPDRYVSDLLRAGQDSAMVARIRSSGTCILLADAPTVAVRGALEGGTETGILENRRGMRVLSTCAPLKLPGLSWVLIAEVEYQEVMAPLTNVGNRLLFLGAIVIAASLLLGSVVARTISRQLAALTRMADDFGRGDSALGAPSQASGEFGRLAGRINAMADNLNREIAERREAGEELRRSRELLQDLSDHLQSIREEERKKIARDIHDDLGQSLAAMKLDLSLVRQELGEAVPSVRQRLESMETLLDGTIRAVKRIITELRPRLLDDLGLTAAIEWQAADFQKRTGLPVTVSIYPREIIVDADRSTALFRIFQEGLSNVARHARASAVSVSLTEIGGQVEFELRDDGCGITKEQINDRRSFGLIGIRERVRGLGGTMEILGRSGEGTRLMVRFQATEEPLTS